MLDKNDEPINNSHVFSFFPGLMNPRGSKDGRPHAHRQLRGESNKKRVEVVESGVGEQIWAEVQGG